VFEVVFSVVFPEESVYDDDYVVFTEVVEFGLSSFIITV
jgi:hypothetical protein